MVFLGYVDLFISQPHGAARIPWAKLHAEICLGRS